MKIDSDEHLHADINRLVEFIVRQMILVNNKLAKKYVVNFVNNIIYSKYFLTTENAYHNLQHTFEVFQMSTHLLKFYKKKHFTRSDCTMIQIAALCHDYGHNGVPNSKWEEHDIDKQKRKLSTNSELSDIITTYESEMMTESKTSYNEIMHIDKTISLIMKYKRYFFPHNADYYVKHRISSLILATDLSQHQTYTNTIGNTFSKQNDMILILKLADISHGLRPFHVHLYWVYKIQKECNRLQETPTIEYLANDTIFFIENFMVSLVTMFIKRCPKAKNLLNNLNDNLRIWNSYISK